MRHTLTVRKPSTEKLLASLPWDAPPDRLGPLRQWSEALMNDASRFQIAKAKKRNSLANGRNNP